MVLVGITSRLLIGINNSFRNIKKLIDVTMIHGIIRTNIVKTVASEPQIGEVVLAGPRLGLKRGN